MISPLLSGIKERDNYEGKDKEQEMVYVKKEIVKAQHTPEENSKLNFHAVRHTPFMACWA